MKNLSDAALSRSVALPNGTATVLSSSIDSGMGSGIGGALLASQPSRLEFQISAPAMNATQMPDGKTMAYSIAHSDNADLSGAVNLGTILVQTGAGGAGCAAASQRMGIPTNAKRYLGVLVAANGSGDASAVSAVLQIYA